MRLIFYRGIRFFFLGAFDPSFVFGLGGFLGVPFYFVCPVCRGKWSACNVLGVTASECLLLSTGLVGAYTLLSETDGPDLVA